MANNRKLPQKTNPKRSAGRQPSKPRRLKQSKYRSFRFSKRIKHPQTLSSSFKIARQSAVLLRRNWRLFGGITLLYGILAFILVRGVGGGVQLSQVKSNLQATVSGSYQSLKTAISLFSYTLSTAGNSQTDTGGLYQGILIIVFSLAIIWGLRERLADKKIRIRQTFYEGLYPLIPFLLVLVVITLQLVPLLIGSWLYSTVIGNGIAVTNLEHFLWALIFFVLALLSLYMVCSSIFALYIVTLPKMTPLKALRSARQLVKYRRWTVLRKILFLPLFLLILGAVIMLPVIMLVTSVAVWVFFVLTLFILVIVHSYMYMLYRDLL